MQAREDYQQLIALAQRIDCVELTPALKENAGWRAIDAVALASCKNLLRARPDLREIIERIYPGLEAK